MNPTGQPSFGSPPPQAGGPGAPGGGPKEKVNIPSLILLVGAGGGVAFNLFGMAQSALGMNKLPEQMANDPNLQQFMAIAEGMQKAGPLFNLLGIAVCAFVLFGALKMRNLQSWGLSLATCIVAIFRCCYSCCCIVTMVGGIWGLVVLNQPDVKSAFTG